MKPRKNYFFNVHWPCSCATGDRSTGNI